MEAIAIVAVVVVGLPWVVLHYITKWKTAATLTSDDELLLEDLYQLARRLDERMETVERLVAADHPDFISGAAPGARPRDDTPLAPATERLRP